MTRNTVSEGTDQAQQPSGGADADLTIAAASSPESTQKRARGWGQGRDTMRQHKRLMLLLLDTPPLPRA